jgi:hypothetical protein
MSRHPTQRVKTFTVQEANATLPLVRAIVGDLVQLSRDVLERRERLAVLGTDHSGRTGDPYQEELAQMEEVLEGDTRQLQEYVRELQGLGVEPKSATDGLVDFPSIMDGRLVYLCWKLGEPEVLYWHELDAGFRGRQPLTAGIESGPGLGDEQTGFDH